MGTAIALPRKRRRRRKKPEPIEWLCIGFSTELLLAVFVCVFELAHRDIPALARLASTDHVAMVTVEAAVVPVMSWLLSWFGPVAWAAIKRWVWGDPE